LKENTAFDSDLPQEDRYVFISHVLISYLYTCSLWKKFGDIFRLHSVSACVVGRL